MGHPKWANATRKYLFILLAVSFVVGNFLNWYDTHHFMDVEIDDRYQIELSAHELESFLDWPIDFEIEVEDLKNGSRFNSEFQSDGPYLQILVSAEDQIWLRGYESGSGDSWLIDLNENTINNSSPVNDEEFELKAEITPDFEIEKK